VADEKHCATCICGKRAPVQGEGDKRKGLPGQGNGSIAWSEHLLAYQAYSSRYGSEQSAERLAARGGFGYIELIKFLGREPETWEPRT
jgi:hypothetical protein